MAARPFICANHGSFLMRNFILLAGWAALALAAPVAAEKGGKGGGQGHGGGKPAKVERGHGGGGHGGGKPARAERGGHGGGHAARAPKDHHSERQAFRAERKDERRAFRAERPAKAERQALRRSARRDDRLVRHGFDERRERVFRDDRRDHRRAVVWGGEPRFVGNDGACPPGLAKKGNGCLPPGQAKKMFARGQRLERDWFEGYRMPAAYQGFYQDSPEYYYRYDDEGYIYRADRGSDLISAIIPLLGGGFGVGQPLPAGYDAYNVPMQYRDDWYDTDDSLYRYGDNAIYEVDAQSGLIEGIVALLAGDLNVGQSLPEGYDAYNLPMDHRDEYTDDEDHLYRYADGNIYQVDAKTQMIQAIVEMLA
jgi:hypothetical protein